MGPHQGIKWYWPAVSNILFEFLRNSVGDEMIQQAIKRQKGFFWKRLANRGKVRQGQGIFEVEPANGKSLQGNHVGSAVEAVAEVTDQASHVGSLVALDFEADPALWIRSRCLGK